jgi:hypothetical protein
MSAIPEISPIGRNQEGIGVRRREKEMQSATTLPLAKDRNRLSFERVARSEDRYLFRESLRVGSLSMDRSTRLIMRCY